MKLWRASLALIVTAVLSAVLLATGTAAGAAAAQPGGGTARASVPWGRVGPGWVLAQYTSAAPEGGSGPAVLYLISPDGTRYPLAHWADWRSAPQLLAWSPDGKRALFQVFSGQGGVELLTLATGQVSTFALPGGTSPIGFTTPRGLAIVGGQVAGTGTSLARYSLSGGLSRQLGYSTDGQVLYAPSGLEFVTGSSHGLKLVSNGGALIRQLTIPRTSTDSCSPARWWNSGTVLASCVPPGSGIAQLWLVPISAARPTVLTPPRSASSRDLGDLDAWQLPMVFTCRPPGRAACCRSSSRPATAPSSW